MNILKENEIRQKAEALAVKLTLEEKIGMIHGVSMPGICRRGRGKFFDNCFLNSLVL